MTYYEDNEGARFNLMGGFSGDAATSLLLALFWGSAAVHQSRPWIARVASGDSPADCLTKIGLPRGHLHGAVSDNAVTQAFWDIIIPCMRTASFPDWAACAALFCGRLQ